ncbi:MAG: hypothetical protein ABIN66_08620 [candidate division WOR-3 bacterium]
MREANSGTPWVWALSALEKFRTELGWYEARPPDRLVAVLLGEAQEGKTSLAMRLLGATREEIGELEKVLRGGRRYGESATQVATIYEATGEKMTKKCLQSIAEEIRKAWNNKPNELRLKLPIKGDVAAVVVDLVGLNPRSLEEGERAIDLTRKWLYLADLLIYVCRADHISNLTPHDVKLSEIMDRFWVNKDTAIIVITFAYEVISPESAKMLMSIREPEELFFEAQKIHKKSLIRQISQRWREVDENDLPLVLPVCLKSGDVDPIQEEATRYAISKIRGIVNENPVRFRVRSGFTYPKQLEDEIKKREGELEREKRAIEEEKEKWQRKLEKLSKESEELKDELDSIKSEIREMHEQKRFLTGLVVHFREKFYLRNQKIRREIPSEGKLMHKVEMLRESARNFVNKIKENLDYAWEELWEELKSQIPYEHRQRVKNAFLSVSNNLHSCLDKALSRICKGGDVVVEGWFGGVKWDESREELINWTYRILEEANEKLIEGLEKHLEPELKKIVSGLQASIGEHEAERARVKKRLDEVTKELNEKNGEFKKWKAESQEKVTKLEEEIKKSKQKLEKAQKYKDYIAGEFLAFWNSRADKINEANDPIEVLNTLACLEEARGILEELVEFAKEKEETS